MAGVPGKVCSECHANLLKLRSERDEKATKYFTDIINNNPNPNTAGFLRDELQSLSSSSLSAEERSVLTEEQNNAIKSIIVSTTDNIIGRNIDSYCTIVSGISVLGTGVFSELDLGVSDILGTSSTAFQGKITVAQSNAITSLKKDAYMHGCNAVIGVTVAFAHLTGNAIGVVATGTAVKLQ